MVAMQNKNELATKRDLLALEERLERRFADFEHRFTEALQQTEHRFTETLQQTEQRFAEALQHTEERFTEALRDTETKLHGAFYSYAEATQKHLADLDGSDSSFRERLGTLEGRIIELERRLNLPPP